LIACVNSEDEAVKQAIFHYAIRLDLILTNDWCSVYAAHARSFSLSPEVEWIGKGKEHKPYEFGVKRAVVVTNEHSLMLGCRRNSAAPDF
jgi:IS5 family transposase